MSFGSPLRRLAIVLAPVWIVAGCSTVNAPTMRIAQAITPYRMDIVQGNVITSEQVQALRSGMDRQSVRGILGTPLIQSVFHADRWDYIFTIKRQGQEAQLRRVSVFFKGDALDRFEADALPTEAEFAASLIGRESREKIPALEATEAQLKAFSAPARPAAAAPARPAPPAVYPPLERAAP